MNELASIETEESWAAVGPPLGFSTSKILVIDDDPAMLKLVELIAAENGYDVVSAASGAAGLRLIMETEPDLVSMFSTTRGHEWRRGLPSTAGKGSQGGLS